MSETTCRSCNSTYSIPSEPRAARKVKDDHSKQCSFAVKNCKGFPVAFVDGKFCCPFRYNGCLFSAKIDPVRKHQCSFGPVTGHTPQTVYGDAASLRPIELGQYIETNYGDTLRGAKKVAGTPSGVESVDASSAKIPSCQTQVNTPDAQPAAVSLTSGEDTGEKRTSAQDDVPQEMHSKDCLTARGSAPALPGMTAETTVATAMAAIPVLTAFTTTPGTSLLRHGNVEAESDRSLQHDTGIENSPSRPQCAAKNDSDCSAIYGSKLPGGSERSESNQGPAEIQIPQVNVDDPLCHVIQVQELEGMSLMTSFQPDLKLFVCERCRFAVWADHLTGHIFNNHKSLLPQSIKRPLVDAAVTRAHDRLQAAQSHQLKVALPQRLLPPLPWLLEPVQGYRCFHCPYVAASTGTISIHSKTLHPGKGHCASKHNQRILVQRLFSRAQYFVVHAMLQSVGPDHLFAKFYSMLPARYLDGAFIDGDMSKTSDPGDLSPFLTTTGWAQATEGYSMHGVRAMSNSKVEILDIHLLARIKGLGKKYLSTISSTSDIEPTLLDALTSWRTRYRPFQILQEKDSIENYGLHCDRLVMMILRAVSSQSSSIEGTVGGPDVVDAHLMDDNTEEKVDDDGECDDGMYPPQDWEDMDFVDEVDEDASESWPESDLTGEEDHEESADLDLSEDQAVYQIELNSVQIRHAKTLRGCCTDPSSSEAWLMDAYHSVVLSVFTTNSKHALYGPLHSLVDSFIMSTSIDMQGRFVPPHLISSHLAKLIYAAMFSILTEVMKTPDPYQAFMSSMKQWMEPGMRTPFCCVRRYSRLCYALCRAHIALPRLQFATVDSPDFTFDGKPLSVTSMTRMYHSVYRNMTSVLDEYLLFGAGDAVLQHLKDPEDIVDQPHEHFIGRGVLASEMQAAWNPIKFMMGNDKLCKKYFSIDPSGNPVPRKGAWEEYLWKVEEFKECFYFLFHQIPGMPKRGSEEVRAKIVDTSFRGRNIMYLFHRLACIGDYNKSSRNTGNDKLTLHFLARPLETVLRRFQASVASISAWAIDWVLAPEDIDPHHHCYLLSSMGKRWTSERLSRILQRLTAKHLPGGISLNMSSLRHILPGIAEHYRISDILSPRTDDVLHAQLGHSQETGDRMYARAHQDHPQLTNLMAHRTMLFCDLWQELLGFGGEVPNEEAALSLQESYTRQRSSSRKSLSLLWKTPSVEAISDPLPLHSYQDFQDRLVSMERSLTQLNNTVTSFQDRLVSMEHSLKQLNNTVISIAQVLLPSIAAPQELLPQLRRPLNSDASIRAETHASQGDPRQRQTHDISGDLRPRNCGASSTSRIIELKQQKTAASHRNTTDDKDQTEEHPLETMRSASVLDNSDGPEDVAGFKSHFYGGHAESEARQDNVRRTYCPKCDINIMGSDSERHAHFTNAKLLEKNSDDGYWHVFCFTATASEALLGPKVRIYRGPDFKFICPCGEFSHYERAEVEAHLASFNADDQGAVTKHKKFRRRPGWTRG